MNLAGKTIVITGAARGLGAAMARRLAPHRPVLALVDLKAADLEAIAAECRQLGATVHAFGANVAKEADVIALFDRAMAPPAGRAQPDVVVFNAGDNRMIDFREVEAALFEAFWRIGCFGR